jgi:hypothetical protein
MEHAPYTYFPLFPRLTSAGTYRADIRAAAPPAALSRFSLKFWINGPTPGDQASLDYVRLLNGAALAALPPTPTPTPTRTIPPPASLVQAYPNPAKGLVHFAYWAAGPVKITLDIYGLGGERVARVSETRDGGSGETLVTDWEAAAAPGIYLARLVVTDGGGAVVLDQRKMVALIR